MLTTTKRSPCKWCGDGDVEREETRYDCLWRAGAGGKQHQKTFNDLKSAEKFLTNTIKDVQDGTYTHVKPLQMDAVFDRWLEDSLEVKEKQGLLKPSTVKSYKSMLRIHLRPAFKDYRSDHLTAKVVSEWERKLANAIAEKKLTAKSYNNLVGLLKLILGWARKRGQRYLAHDPLEDLAPLPSARTERDFLEPDEIKLLLGAAQPPIDTILYLAIYSGLRRGELFGLQWGDLDEQHNVLRIRRSIYQGDVTSPKTTHSERTVDLPTPIVTRLQEYREVYPPLEGDFIFRTATGTPIDPDNWYGRHFVPTVKRAKLRPIGLHTLRHTYASLLINMGEGIKYVSKQLGHASIQITADLYGHLFKETSVSAMNRLAMRIPVAKSDQKADEVA